MENLRDLRTCTPQEWDEQIRHELDEAGITIHKFREYDSPYFWVKHTLKGKLGKWIFSRDKTIYAFWGDVPLSTAEVIATDSACLHGCVPGQWFSGWPNKPVPVNDHLNLQEKNTSWIDENGMFRVTDDNYSDGYKEALQHDANWKLLFVDDPSADGKPYVQTYTFFTQTALNNFVKICKRHRLECTHTY